MESCPACGRATISHWRRWFAKKSDSFQCASCATWIALRDPKEVVKRFKHPNLVLFVFAPFGALGATLAFIVATKHLPKSASSSAAAALLVVMLVGGVRRILRSQYVVLESQTSLGMVQAMRIAWREPAFRAWLGKVTLSMLEMFALFTLLRPLVRLAENAL